MSALVIADLQAANWFAAIGRSYRCEIGNCINVEVERLDD
jgi:hypothetical protein